MRTLRPVSTKNISHKEWLMPHRYGSIRVFLKIQNSRSGNLSMRTHVLEDNELIDITVSYAPFENQMSHTYLFSDWDEAYDFVKLSLFNGFVVQISIVTHED